MSDWTFWLMARLILGFFLVAASASLVVCWRIHSSNAAEDQAPFLEQAPPRAGERILIFSPHCDDEALGAGGFIAAAVRAGANVRIVMMTNGDGFELAAAWQYKKLQVTPQLLLKFALERQKEAVAADAALGVRARDIVFLGFPDQGLAHLWNDNWSAEHPYLSTKTRCDHNPYAHTPHPGQAYAGSCVLQDVEEQIRLFHPNLVLSTHPNDDHPDHWATCAFVRAALADLARQGDPSAAHAAFRVFVVHHGDWPVPQGFHPNVRMGPPYALARTDTVWREFPLAAADERSKLEAIRAYRSQMAMMSRFLLSFVRKSECFGDVAPAVLNVGSGSEALPVLISASPLSDNLLRAARADGNIDAIDARQDTDRVCIWVRTRGQTSGRISYSLYLKHISQGGQHQQEWKAVVRGSHAAVNIPGGKAVVSGRRLQVFIPLVLFRRSPDWFVSASTHLGSLTVDRAGWREFHVRWPAAAALPAPKPARRFPLAILPRGGGLAAG